MHVSSRPCRSTLRTAAARAGRRTVRALGLVAALALGPGTAEAGELIVVDAAGGAGSDFTDLEAAVQAASAGATLVVREGDYTLTTVLTKGLTFVAAAGSTAPPHIEHVSGTGAIEFVAVPADEVVVFRGFDLGSIEFVDMLGHVWVEDCNVVGGVISLRVHNNESVTIRNCTIGSGLDAFGDPSQPLYITGGSTVQVFGSRLRASTAGGLGCVHRPAAEVRHASSFFAADSLFQGSGCVHNGSSGGLSARENSTLRLRNSVSEAGVGTPQVADIELFSGATFEEVDDIERGIVLGAPLLAGTSTPLGLNGGATEQVVVIWSLEPDSTFSDPLYSVLSVAPPWQLGGTTRLDALGAGTLQVLSGLPPGLESLTVFVQAAFASGSEVRVGSPSAVPVVARAR